VARNLINPDRLDAIARLDATLRAAVAAHPGDLVAQWRYAYRAHTARRTLDESSTLPLKKWPAMGGPLLSLSLGIL
jgi:hypothetical protein